MNVIIRKAKIEDLKIVQELNFKLFDLEYNNFDPALDMEWTLSEAGESYFKGLIKEGTVWVAVENDNVIGYMACKVKGKPSCATKTLAVVDNFYIENGYRRKGIGKELLQAFKEYCKNQSIEEITVTTNSKNINAREFYKCNGFDDFEVIYKMKVL